MLLFMRSGDGTPLKTKRAPKVTGFYPVIVTHLLLGCSNEAPVRFLRLSEADSPGECSSHLHPHQSEVLNIKPQCYISRIVSGLSEVNQYIKDVFSEFLKQKQKRQDFPAYQYGSYCIPCPSRRL